MLTAMRVSMLTRFILISGLCLAVGMVVWGLVLRTSNPQEYAYSMAEPITGWIGVSAASLLGLVFRTRKVMASKSLQWVLLSGLISFFVVLSLLNLRSSLLILPGDFQNNFRNSDIIYTTNRLLPEQDAVSFPFPTFAIVHLLSKSRIQSPLLHLCIL